MIRLTILGDLVDDPTLDNPVDDPTLGDPTLDDPVDDPTW